MLFATFFLPYFCIFSALNSTQKNYFFNEQDLKKLPMSMNVHCNTIPILIRPFLGGALDAPQTIHRFIGLNKKTIMGIH